MGNAIAIIVILLGVGFVVIALVDAARTFLSLKNGEDADLCDPETCDHEWETSDSGTCMPSYSSTGGPDPQETWTIERCPLCGTTHFHCTGSCDPDECDMDGSD